MTSPFGPLTLILGPPAGRPGAEVDLPTIERALRDRDLEFVVVQAAAGDDVTGAARRALESGGRFLVAVGGDGTVNEVVNGMFTDGRPVVEDPVLGVVTAGAGSDFVRTFGLPERTAEACRHLAGDNTYPLDVGKITCLGPDGETRTRYFANVAEAGLGAAAAGRSRRLPPAMGRLRQFLGFWLTLARFPLAHVRVQADRRSYEGPAYSVVIGNGQYAEDGMKVSPRSYPGDGVLDCLVFKGPRSDAFTLLNRKYRGEHVPSDHVVELRAKVGLRIESDRPLPIQADGEIVGTTPASLQVIPKCILMKL